MKLEKKTTDFPKENGKPQGRSGREFFLTLLKRTGRSFIPIIITIVQLPFLPGAVVGAVIIQFNAEFTPQQILQSGFATLTALLLGTIFILIFITAITRQANERLDIWAKTGSLTEDSGNERLAWKQIASLPWNYGISASLITIFVNILPVVAYQYYILKISTDQAIYSFFGAVVPAMVVITLAILSLERMLLPAREALLPQKFENQLKAGANSYIFGKFLFVGLTLIGVTALLLAPIGYRQTYKAIYETIGSLALFSQLQTMLIGASIIAFVVGLSISFLLSRSVTEPIESLIQTFIKVEKGNLSERARVLATDEIGELSIYFNHMISRLDEFQQTLEQRVLERTEQLRASNEVGRIASTILDPDTVITRVVELITETFGYYYASIFLVADNERWAELKDATGAAGATLKARGHRLPINKSSMVGASITSKEPQVALDVGNSAIRFNNPLLPNTRSEIAIPLMIGDRVIGALDVQSTRGADFKPEDIATLQSMASQVAIAIENARLFKEMEQALDELRQANRQYIQSAWTDKLKSSRLEYTAGSVSTIPDEDTREIEVKLNLRDENIGHIRFDAGSDWSQEDQGWVEALATQVAISLENARLVEESQQAALRERLSASIIQKLWAINSIDGIMQTAVRELGRALEASEATIKLNVEE